MVTMRVHKPIRLLIPKSASLAIETNITKDKEYCIYLIHYIVCKPIRDKRFTGFVPLNRQKLSSVIGSKLNTCIKLLEKYELLECDKQAIRGQKTYYYRINPAFNTGLCFYDLQPNSKLFKNLLKQITTERTNYSKLPFYLNEMRKEFMNLDFDFQAALKYCESVEDISKKINYALSINMLQDTRFRYFKRNSTNNRLDTNLTNLKKDLRRFIGADYVSIDLKNSQPFFLSFLLEKLAKILNHFHLKKLELSIKNKNQIVNIKYIPLCLRNDLLELSEIFGIKALQNILIIRKKTDFSFFTNYSKYKKWVTEGNFYDEFVKEFGDNLQREDVKKIMFEVLFSKNVHYDNFRKFIPFEKEKKIFASVFPVIYAIIEQLKERDNALLPIYLQKLESRIFIDCIAKELVEAGIIPLTIHDSVLVKEHQKEQSLNIIQSVFKREIGIVPAFHVEVIKQSKIV